MRTLTLLSIVTLSLLAETVGGLKWTPPAGWKSEGTAPMRAATYKIPPASAGTDGAECVVYFFGPGQGGGVQRNIDRWASQVSESDGTPSKPKVEKRTVHGLPVTTIDVSGIYTAMANPMAPETAPKSDYRVLGAIIENPGGNVFLKFTGPAKLIGANEAKFEELLNSFQKE
jgi:hypothetical protein